MGWDGMGWVGMGWDGIGSDDNGIGVDGMVMVMVGVMVIVMRCRALR